MPILESRRRLLRLAAALPASLPVWGMTAVSGSEQYAWHPLASAGRVAGIPAGAIVLVDDAIVTFGGDGLYLYPDWGDPAVYEVRVSGNGLAFHTPGATAPLWRLEGTLAQVRFCGRVEGIVHADDLAHHHTLRSLRVPEFPAA